MKTVKEMSQISGISVRTLHYYDQIGLLTPSFIGENGYRFYDMDAFERLQEILLFRELEFPLKKIKEILSDPSYDKEEALCEQIKWLELKKEHMARIEKRAFGKSYLSCQVLAGKWRKHDDFYGLRQVGFGSFSKRS